MPHLGSVTGAKPEAEFSRLCGNKISHPERTGCAKVGGGACSRSWEALSDPQGSRDCARAIKKKPAPDTRRAPPSRHVTCMPPLGAARLLPLTHYLTRIFTHCPEDSLAGRDRARLTPGGPRVERQVSSHGGSSFCDIGHGFCLGL